MLISVQQRSYHTVITPEMRQAAVELGQQVFLNRKKLVVRCETLDKAKQLCGSIGENSEVWSDGENVHRLELRIRSQKETQMVSEEEIPEDCF